MVRCECGGAAIPIWSIGTGDNADEPMLVGYRCHEHGLLHHSAIINEEDHMEEPKQEVSHAVYVRDVGGTHMMLNSSYKYPDDAFIKAKELYDAYDEVAVSRVTVERR